MRAWLLASFLWLALSRGADAADLLLGNFNASEITQLDGASGEFEGFLEPVGTMSLPASGSLKVGPDGQLWVGSPGALRRFDLATGNHLGACVSGLTGSVLNFVFAPDGSIWGTLGPGHNLFHANGTTCTLLGPLVPSTYPSGMDIGPDGNLYVASWTSQRISRFNITTGAFISDFPVPIAGAGVAAIRFGPDGKLYAAIGTGTDIVRFDGVTGAYLGPFIPSGDPHPTSPYFFVWGPDGHLYVSSNGSGEVLKYDEATGAFLGVFTSDASSPSGLAFVPDRTANQPSYLQPVHTTSGEVLGLAAANGVRTYKGIRYAEPPTGALRWKRPVRRSESPTPIKAIAHGPQCPQPGGGSEDCLRISLWAAPNDPNAPPLPVLFHIHGGSHVSGGIGGIADGTALAHSQNIIVAEAQYRLGALGFFGLPALAAEDPNGSTGNYGLLDHLEALRWLRDNVAAFGGDPNQITISGQSAGGHSVCALLGSPLSDGLFRAAIIDSGQCIYARPLDLPTTSPVRSDPFVGPTVYDHSTAIAASAGCSASDLVCLRGKSAVKMVEALAAQPKALTGEQRAIMAIDGYVLPETPISLLRQGAADHRPLMIGSVADEATLFFPNIGSIITNPASYEAVVRLAAGNTRADALLPLYPAGSDPAETFRQLFADTIFVCTTLDDADAVAANGSPAWVYHMSFAPTYFPGSPNAGLRTYHSLDLYYEFGNYSQLAAAGIAVDADDIALSESMQNAWGSFVRTGVPTTTAPWPVYAPATPGDLGSVSVMLFDSPNHTVPGNLFRSGRCASLLPVANFLDGDRDVATYEEDNCPVTTNTNQADAELDTVGDACDNCRNVANPRVAADFLTANPWATLTGGQRDDDHDGYGNKCDGKFPGVAGLFVGNGDLAEWRASNTKNRTLDQCGTAGDRPCAIYDLDEAGLFIGNGDLAQWRLLNTKQPGPKCPTCPLACTSGTSGDCP